MKSNKPHRALCFLFFVGLSGCSTGPFLKPEATSGTYNRENSSCPGEKDVVEFRPDEADWIVFRVHAKLPSPYRPEGTRLLAYFDFQYLLPEPPREGWSLFPNSTEKEEQKNLEQRRSSQHIEITASSPYATILLPDGTKTQVLLALFERPYSHNEAYAYGSGKVERGVVISPNALDSFTVIFPDIFINGKKMDIPPVKFGISKAKYVPVLNC